MNNQSPFPELEFVQTETSQLPGPQPVGQAAVVGCQILDSFAFDRDELTAVHRQLIGGIAKNTAAALGGSSSKVTVRITGHSDPVGTPAYNFALAKRRAERVAVELRAAMERIRPGSSRQVSLVTESQGQSQPVSRDNAKNRRVEICPPAPVRPPLPLPTPQQPSKDISQQVQRWFITGGAPPMQPVRADNEAIPLVGGTRAFTEMVKAIRSADSGEHYIYLLGWILEDRFPLTPADPTTTIEQLFRAASQKGVQIRAMLWDQFGTTNTPEYKRIDGLANGAAILDNRTLHFGAHHQKVLVVKGREGLLAFCGGVDINSDRIFAAGSGSSGGGSGSGGGGAPLHDVHCRVRGPAAHDLLRVFEERWLDHPDHVDKDRAKGRLRGLSEPMPQPAGKMYVQIGRTYGNGSRYSGIGHGGYRFAPQGEQTIRRMVLRAISQARRFIYMEDQYLVSMEIRDALIRALPSIDHLTIVIPHTSLFADTDCPQDFHAKRRSFIAPLRRAGGNKVRVFHLHPPGAPNTYVHSKMWVFDDEFAIIGSANCNRRGYTHDSEVAAAIFDPGSPSTVRELRIALWAKHLNMNTLAGRAALQDGVASAGFWLARPAGAHVAPFNEMAGISKGNALRCSIASWDGQIDPDGS